MAVSMVDGCRASYTAERWLESAGRRCVYPEVICFTSLPEYRGLTAISHPDIPLQKVNALEA
jgi:hypothetical protein